MWFNLVACGFNLGKRKWGRKIQIVLEKFRRPGAKGKGYEKNDCYLFGRTFNEVKLFNFYILKFLFT